MKNEKNMKETNTIDETKNDEVPVAWDDDLIMSDPYSNLTDAELIDKLKENFNALPQDVVDYVIQGEPDREIGTKVNLLKYEIESWLNRYTFKDFYQEIKKGLIGQPNLRLFLGNVYNYLYCLVEDRPIRNNVLLTAPSGCGKTETYRLLKEYFKKYIPSLPVHYFDLTSITSTGFKGADAQEILRPFSLENDEGKGVGYGLCFLDEFDKKLLPCIATNGGDANYEVQTSLLAIVEGEDVATRNGICNGSKMMFIGMGSFDYFRDKRDSKTREIGFGAKEDSTREDRYAPITREDMIKVGGSNELIGRFPLIINYQRLSEEAVDSIIDKIVYDLESAYQCRIVLDNKYRNLLHKASLENFGCRLIDSEIREQILSEYTKALSEVLFISKNDLYIRIMDKDKCKHYVGKKGRKADKEAMAELLDYFY